LSTHYEIFSLRDNGSGKEIGKILSLSKGSLEWVSGKQTVHVPLSPLFFFPGKETLY
jgi:hypothetical protein